MALFAFFLMAIISQAQPDALFSKGRLTVHTAGGPVTLAVEIADTDDARSRGLMFRQSLGEREGMLFLFDRQEPITMWMKNTYIPLDMVFIDADRRVVDIARNTEPLSTDIIASRFPALWVLEIIGGSAAALGIKPGDRVDLQR